jgi:hypothetical protein
MRVGRPTPAWATLEARFGGDELEDLRKLKQRLTAAVQGHNNPKILEAARQAHSYAEGGHAAHTARSSDFT